jgi:hypothetical protein
VGCTLTLRLRSRHPRCLLAQFGLTPKSRRGLGAGEVVDAVNQPTVPALQPLRSSLAAGFRYGSVTAPLRASLAGLFPPPATLLDGTAEHTKAQVADPVARREPVAVRRTAVAGAAAPAATPVHPDRA